MGELKLTFLDNPIELKKLDPTEAILRKYGQEICDYAKGYFNYVATTYSGTYVDANGSYNFGVTNVILYIIASEIGYDYKILELSYRQQIEMISISFFTLKGEEETVAPISMQQDDWELLVDNKIRELLSSPIANATFKSLIDEILQERKGKAYTL